MSRDRLTRLLGPFSLLVTLVVVTVGMTAQSPVRAAADVTFAKEIAPILQRSCQGCHHADASRRCRW